MNKKNFYQLAGFEIANFIRKGSVSSVEIAKAFIDRTRAVESKIHAWTSMNESYILSQANQIDELVTQNRLGLLAGVPIGIKDIFNTEFYSTQKGCAVWKNYQSGNDARCVSYLRRENAIIFGKTDTAELAVHANGNSFNPHNPLHVTGSSSSGSAAAVASAMVPMALGSQTGGSIIRPASWCGTYAMKPSFGLIPRTGVLKTTDTLDTIGFFTRYSADLSFLLDAMRVRGDNFPTQETQIKKYRDSIDNKKWRVAFCNHPIALETFSYAQDSLQKFKDELSSVDGVEVTTVDLPKSTHNYVALHRRIYHPCLEYYLRTEFNRDPDAISDTLKDIFNDAKTISPSDYKNALMEQASLAHDLESFFSENEIDVMIFNSSNGSAPYASEPSIHKDLNCLWTMAWLPVINIPKFKCDQGLPFGLQMIAPRYSDYKMLAFLSYLCEREVIPFRSEIATPLLDTVTQEIAIEN